MGQGQSRTEEADRDLSQHWAPEAAPATADGGGAGGKKRKKKGKKGGKGKAKQAKGKGKAAQGGKAGPAAVADADSDEDEDAAPARAAEEPEVKFTAREPTPAAASDRPAAGGVRGFLSSLIWGKPGGESKLQSSGGKAQAYTAAAVMKGQVAVEGRVIARTRPKKLAAAGIHLGAASCVVAVHTADDAGGIPHLVRNELDETETVNMVALRGEQRYVGTAAKGQMGTNPAGTVRNVRDLLGRVGVPETHYPAVRIGTDMETPGLAVAFKYRGDDVQLRAEFLQAMQLRRLLASAQGALESRGGMRALAIAIPYETSGPAARALLDALAVAEAPIDTPHLVYDSTAALACWAFRNVLPVTSENARIVLLVDVGASKSEAVLARIHVNSMTILARSCLRDVGARDFDLCLHEHCCEAIAAKYKLDVRANAKASMRLLREVEKAKSVLSANKQADVRVECLMDDVDVDVHVTRDEFNELTRDLVDRFADMVADVVAVSAPNVIEVMGGGMRIPAIREAVAIVAAPRALSMTLDTATAVAVGAALVAAVRNGDISHFKIDEPAVDIASDGLDAAAIDEMIGVEHEMFKHDELVRATADARNELEALLFDTQARMPAAGAKPLRKALARIQDWLDATTSSDTSCLGELEKQLDELKALVGEHLAADEGKNDDA